MEKSCNDRDTGKNLPSNLVLVADDDEDDRFLIAETLKAFKSLKVDFVLNGKELIDYLQQKEKPPSLILLDLNMPVLDGREALKFIHQNPELSKIPVVVLSTSSEKEDQLTSEKFGAKAFMTKPSRFDDWIILLKSATSWIAPAIVGNEKIPERNVT